VFGISFVVVLAAIFLFYFTPHIALLRMSSAARDRDAKTFCSYIDFPVLRENMKAELNAQMLARMKDDENLKNNPFSGFATALAPAMINNMVDAYVTPAAVEKGFETQPDEKAPAPAKALSPEFLSREKGTLSQHYNSFDEFEISYSSHSGGSAKLMLERRGLFRWQLTNIKFDLPRR
jgi:hypothetical protein